MIRKIADWLWFTVIPEAIGSWDSRKIYQKRSFVDTSDGIKKSHSKLIDSWAVKYLEYLPAIIFLGQIPKRGFRSTHEPAVDAASRQSEPLTISQVPA